MKPIVAVPGHDRFTAASQFCKVPGVYINKASVLP